MAYLEDRVTHLENEVSRLTETVGVIFKYILEPYRPASSTPVDTPADVPADVPTKDAEPNSNNRLYSYSRPLSKEQGKEWVSLLLAHKEKFLEEYKKSTKKGKNGCVIWMGSYTTAGKNNGKKPKIRIPQTRIYRSVGVSYINTRVAYWAILNKKPVFLTDRVTNTCKVEGCVAKEHLKFLTLEDSLISGLKAYKGNRK